MRDMRLFALHDKSDDAAYKVEAIHDAAGYRKLRSSLARQYDVGFAEANIQVTGANLKGDRKLFLAHRMHQRRAAASRDPRISSPRISSGFGVTRWCWKTSTAKTEPLTADVLRSPIVRHRLTTPPAGSATAATCAACGPMSGDVPARNATASTAVRKIRTPVSAFAPMICAIRRIRKVRHSPLHFSAPRPDWEAAFAHGDKPALLRRN